EVEVVQTATAVARGHGGDEAEVGDEERLVCPLARADELAQVALPSGGPGSLQGLLREHTRLDLPREHDLFLGGQQGVPADLGARLDGFQSAVLAPYATTAALPAGRAVAHGADHESGQPGSADPAVRPRRQRPATARPVSLLAPAGPGVTLPLTPRLDDFPASRASRSSRSPPPNCSCACKPRPGPSRKTPGRPPTTSCPMSSPRTAGHVTIRRAADGPRPGPGGKYR